MGRFRPVILGAVFLPQWPGMPSQTADFAQNQTPFAKLKSNVEDLKNERHSRRGDCVFRHFRARFALHALAPAPIFYRMFSLFFFRADRIWRGVCSPWRSDITPPGCHRLVFCNTILSHRGHDRTAHLVVASQITAVFTRGDDALKAWNGSKAGGRRFRESCRLF